MSEQSLLQALQRELAIEKAARQELEKQTVLKTRQLWHLREQQGKELQQYQEQLSVLRASLILAHKQKTQHKDPYNSLQQHSRAASQSPAAHQLTLQEASTRHSGDAPASPTKADQSKAARHFTSESPQKLKSFTQQQQQNDQQQQNQQQEQQPVTSTSAGTAVLPEFSTPPTKGISTSTAATPSSKPDQQNNAGQPDHHQQQHQHISDTAEQLLAAASKVQQLVEQLSASEPSAAADLSVLQWQLTAVYGSLTCSNTSVGNTVDCSSSGSKDCQDNATQPSNSNSSSKEPSSDIDGSGVQGQPQQSGVLQGVACDGSDPLSTVCSPATATANSQHNTNTIISLVDAATGTSPQREAAADGTQLDPCQLQQSDPDLQAACRIAAAAQLFSGAANSSSSGGGSKLLAASLAWYYLEPGDPPIVKGPYDAGLMLRWFLKGFLDNALRIAGVVHSSSSSSGFKAPPELLGDFQPLGQLLQQVQQGLGYTPAKPCKDLQPPSPAHSSSRTSPSSKLSKHQQHAGLYGISAPGSGGYTGVGGAGGGDVSVLPGDGILAKGGSLLSETVGYWLDMAASAQLPGSMSLVDIIDKVISNVAP